MSASATPNKMLHIVRHGKAVQDYYSIADIDRPLVEKGILANMMMADRFKSKYIVPSLIISSPAARALHTTHIFARILGYPSDKVQVNDALYMHGEDAALDILYGLPDETESVMLVAHNPDMSYLANMFVRPLMGSLPTSGIVSIGFDTTPWNTIFGHVVSSKLDHPKM